MVKFRLSKSSIKMFLNSTIFGTNQPIFLLKNWSEIFFVIFLAGFITALFTLIVNKYTVKFPLGKRNEDGRLNEKFKVRIGGIAIFLGFFVVFYAFFNFSDFNFNSQIPYQAIFLGGSTIFFIGIVDDLIYLSPKIRLSYQFISAILVWFYGLRFGDIDISFLGLGFNEISLNMFLNCLITVVFLVGMTNAINWIDGLDGLASGNIFISSFGIFIIYLFSNNTIDIFLMPLCLAGCALGFLFFNFYPAKIYMGDGGSNFLGFMLASITILLTQINSSLISLPTIVFINFLPAINMIIVVIERIINGLSPFYPDRRHIHHKIMNLGISHKNSVLLLYLFSILFVKLAIYF